MGDFFTRAWASISEFFRSIGDKADIILIGFIEIIGVLVLAKLFIMILRRGIKRMLKKSSSKKPLSAMAKKSDTIASVSISVAKYIVYFFAAATILGILGLGATVGSLLATAGIGGIALAFGAQSLVRDVVAGMFMLAEDQYAVGEYVDLGDEEGTVEAITIRTTRLLKFTGELVTISNGSITKVKNFSRGDHLAVLDIPISYDSDIEKASQIMNKMGLEYKANHDNILDEPRVLGVKEIGDSGVVLRMIVKVKPLTHWETERALRRDIKEAFDRQGISMSYPHRVVISK